MHGLTNRVRIDRNKNPHSEYLGGLTLPEEVSITRFGCFASGAAWVMGNWGQLVAWLAHVTAAPKPNQAHSELVAYCEQSVLHVQIGGIAALHRALVNHELLWAEKYLSLHITTYHDRVHHAKAKLFMYTQNPRLLHEAYTVGRQYHMGDEGITEIVLPMLEHFAAYYHKRLAPLTQLPLAYAELLSPNDSSVQSAASNILRLIETEQARHPSDPAYNPPTSWDPLDTAQGCQTYRQPQRPASSVTHCAKTSTHSPVVR